ncbi:NAD(P)/FAD-dependent oxidoreductase [Streptomyces virginiae]|uniref:NAD(P)/FAD-dependent oxidoreductase n=1 Tax=Streptomyces virginiae TaxID=1961 RepID=UPI00366850A6
MTRTAPSRRTVVVIGGSMAGMLAAAALAKWANVTVIDRDALPAQPTPRKNLPQGRHVHLLWSGGAAAIEKLLPGVMESIHADGVHRVTLPTNMVALSPEGWFRRWRESHYMIVGSRDRLDWNIRKHVLALPHVSLLDRTDVLALEGDSNRITGVRVRTDGQTEARFIGADLVVDAAGRSSRVPQWLTELGLDAPTERTVDAGLVYASRVFRAPTDLKDHPVVVNIQANPNEPGPGQSAVLVPIEDNRWLVTLSGTRGAEPTGNNEEFQPFARSVRHPMVGQIIEHAEPLSDVALTRTTANHRRFYEKTTMPEGLVVTGDAVAAFNPVYGHGMSVAAQSAVALRTAVAKNGWHAPDLSNIIQKAIAKPVSAAWSLSTAQDVFYPGATPNGPTLAERLGAGYVRRLLRASTGSGRVARAVTDVMTLERPAFPTLFTPAIVLSAILGPQKPQLTGPPLTADEKRALIAPSPASGSEATELREAEALAV